MSRHMAKGPADVSLDCPVGPVSSQGSQPEGGQLGSEGRCDHRSRVTAGLEGGMEGPRIWKMQGSDSPLEPPESRPAGTLISGILDSTIMHQCCCEPLRLGLAAAVHSAGSIGWRVG